MKSLLLLTLIITSCAMPQRANQSTKPQKAPSRLDLRQDRILRCTNLFIDKGVEFDSAVKGCKDDIYYK